jgi:hypothetical protein
MTTLTKNKFKFKKHATIGAEGAEEDEEYLYDCFVDTGDLDVLEDINHPSRIVVGRTGSGKTALLMKLNQSGEHVSWIEPDELSLQYLSNSTIIKWLTKNDVDLDIFYRLLWKHIFTVELIKLKYDIKNENDQNNFLQRIYQKFVYDRKKKEAFEYLKEWGTNF